MDPLAGKTANTPRLEPVSTSRQRIAERARHAPGMAWVIFIASWTNGYATARSEAICRGAGCGRTRTSGSVGARVSNDPGLPDLGKGLARHPVPVMLLARLAVDLTWQGRGLGKALVKDALLRTAAAADIAGIRALLVHAKDDEARGWYEALEFEPSPTDPYHLFLLMKDLRAMLSE